MSSPREYEFDVQMLVTAESESDAYSQVSDSGIASGALIGTVLIMGLGLLEDTTREEPGVPS